MIRSRFLLLVVGFAATASAQFQVFNTHPDANPTNCNLLIPSTADAFVCDKDLDRGVPSMCSIKFVNMGTDPCTGHFKGHIGPVTQGSVDQASTSGIVTTCRAVGLTPLGTVLNGVSALESAALCEGDGTISAGGLLTMTARILPSATFLGNSYGVGVASSFATSDITFLSAAVANFDLANCNLSLSSPPSVPSGVAYSATWSAAATQTTYEIQEATQPDFSDAKTSVIPGTSQQFTHSVTSATTYYYRVRASTCRGSAGPYSPTASTVVNPPLPSTSTTFDIVVPQGTSTVIQQPVHFQGLTPNVPFAATVDKPFLSVAPTTGTTSASGTVEVTVSASTSSLGIGANTGTVTITTSHAKTAGRIVPLDGNTQSTPISVSVATPVTQTPKTPPPTSTWIIPAVAHTDGIGAQFISDIRLANVNPTATSSYQLTFTASNSDGTKSGRQTKIDLTAGTTVALNDILKTAFGLATTAADASGVLEIRALGTPNAGTIASSRTYSVNTAGSFGQLVPAVPIDKVASAGGAPLILAHTGQTSAQRMNLGLVESLGFATSGHIRAYAANGQLLADVPFTLRPFEQQQINSFLARNSLNVSSAHIEVSVDPAPAGTTAGGVTAYASMLDNQTQDASVVAGVKASALTSKRYVVPGIATGTPVGGQSEVRVLNAGTSAADATFTFYPRNGSAVAKTASIAAGEIKSFDNIVASLFGASASDGSLVVTTGSDSQLLITSRTFNSGATGGSYGVLQTALTPADGLATADSDLNIVQLEESDRFRTDLGLAELSGAPATVHVTFYSPDSKTSASADINLNANEYRDEQSIISRMTGSPAAVYNGRLAVKVTSGSGRVAAYGALVDKATNDSTLLPAQR